MSYYDVRSYIANRQIPQLFESLMAGLVYTRPDDHISYVQECLRKMKLGKVNGGIIRWNTFINPETPRSQDLPPVKRNANSKTQNSRRSGSNHALPPIIDCFENKAILKKKPCSLYHCTKLSKDVGKSPLVMFVVGLQQTLLIDLCREVTWKNHKIVHLDTSEIMKSRMAVEGFTTLTHVPSCAVIDSLVRTVCVVQSGTMVLITDFPRTASDCEDWKLKNPSNEFFILVLDESDFIQSLDEEVRQKKMSKAEKIRLEKKNTCLQEVLQSYQTTEMAEVIAPTAKALSAAITKHC